MSTDRIAMICAGTISLLGFVLASLLDPWWILLSVFVGLMLVLGPITGFCPCAWIIEKARNKNASSK